MVGSKIKTQGKIQRKGKFGNLKSKKSLRMIFVKTPGGITVTQFKKKKPSKAKCAKCGAVLPGIARERPYKMQNMPKTKKKTTRPYGGNLCSKCTRKNIIAEARK